jgi:hypothetical protein
MRTLATNVNTMEPTTSEENHVSQGPGPRLTGPLLIGAAAVVVLVLGGLYLWQSGATTGTMESAYSDVDSESWMPRSGQGDDAASILAELEATNMAEFESNMNADAEASASSL